MMMENNKQRVSHFFETFSSGDLDGVAEAMHPGGCWWVSGRIEGLSGTCSRAESHATLKNGKVYDNQYHFLIEIKEGKILTVKEYMDTHFAFETFMA